MQVVRYSGENDWSALYVDGKLERVGDHYLIDERISELLGVELEQNDDFMQGGKNYEDVAQTLDEARTYERTRLQKEFEIEQLEQRAADLQQQADEIRKNLS